MIFFSCVIGWVTTPGMVFTIIALDLCFLRAPSGFRLGAERKVMGLKACDRSKRSGFPCLRSFEKPVFRAFPLRARKRLCAGCHAGDEARERLIMPMYEHVFLTRQDASNAQVDQLEKHWRVWGVP